MPAWKLWCFRLGALVLLPLLFFAVLELGLRVAGFGYPTAFLLPAEAGGQSVWIPNARFGWRFFSHNMAREPEPFSLARQKPANTIRIFVLGESAAYGDPQPDFGLPRMLGAMLNLRYPATRFEVVNAAMTGINSHAIQNIARDCAQADADVWVVYMGNNEVVGPFGAGTVFSQQTPSRGFIRSSLALKTTRTGQLLDSFVERLRPLPAAKNEWGGMVMFLDQAVPADDPRMNRVYDHFQHNLIDIINAGRRAGVGLVLSTVAVNLKDCAPFASAHKPALAEADQARWKEDYAKAVRAEESGNLKAALAAYDEAVQLDDTVAELYFRRAQCQLAARRIDEAQRDYIRARDLDTLRFRCDSRINDIIRDSARKSGILLADAERVFAASSTNGIPGNDLFYEHVHLTWEGNWLLTRTLADQVADLLPAGVTNHATAIWPTPAECARRLAWTDRNRRDALALVLGRRQDPPFTHQLNQDTQSAALRAQMERLAPAASAAGLSAMRRAVELAATNSPDDPVLQERLAEARRQTGDLDGAIAAARRVTEILPHAQAGWSQLGLLLVQAQQNDEAARAIEAALNIDPDNAWALNNLAQLHVRMGRDDDALREYQRVVTLKPRFGLAHLGIGKILEKRGRTAEAEEHYQLAVQNRIYRAEELTTLGRFCLTKGWYSAAVTNLQDALKLNPDDPSLHRDLAEVLSKLGRKAEADRHRAAIAQTDAVRMQTYFRRGVDLGRSGKPAEAAEQFREVVRLMPDLAEGRLNLALALEAQGLNREALEQFRETLRLSPTNQQAAAHVRLLEAPPNP